MAKTRHGKNPDPQEEDTQEVIEVSDTTTGGSTAPEDNPGNPAEDYIERLGILGRVWLDNVRHNHIEAYRELLDQLSMLASEAYPLLAEAVGDEVLGCIPDTSGRYLIRDRAYLLQIEKEDCIIQRKNWKKVGQASQKEEVQKALDEYYEEADTVHKSQNTAMEAIEELGDIVDDHDTLVQILKHVQNPCIQVTATMEKYAYILCYPRGEEAAVPLSNFIGAMEELAMRHSVYMEKLWQVMQVATTNNATLTIMNNVSIPPIQVTVTPRDQVERAEGKPIQELALRHLPDPQTLPPSCTESTRVLAALLRFVLQGQVGGQQATAAECAAAFQCDANLMVQVTTGKKTKGKGGRGAKRKSSAATGSRSSPRKKAKTTEPKKDDDNEDDD